MNGHTRLGVAFASPDSHADQMFVTVNVSRSIKIGESWLRADQLSAIGGHDDDTAGAVLRTADSLIVQNFGGQITLVLRLSATGSGGSSSAGVAASPASMARCKRRCGAVTNWQPDRAHGFIRDSVTGESFWFSPRQFVYADSAECLAIGTKLAFVATGTAKGRKNRRAGGILVVGEKADGRLISCHPAGKPCGWVRVEGDQGNHPLVYVPRRELSGCKVGDILTFAVAANDKGAFARRVERLAADEAA
jgi:hypothetical protein